MARVLVPLPDRGYDVTEASVPWRMLTDQGHEVIEWAAIEPSRYAGQSVLHASRTTSLTKAQERTAYYLSFWKLGRYYRTYPAYVEDEVKAALDSESQYLRGPLALTARGSMTDDRAAFVVEDGRYLSARWPGDAYLFARKLLERLTPATAPR